MIPILSLERAEKALIHHGFEAVLFQDAAAAVDAFLHTLPASQHIALSDSVTLRQLRLPDLLRQAGHAVLGYPELPVQPFPEPQKSSQGAMEANHYLNELPVPPPQAQPARLRSTPSLPPRDALEADHYLCSTNALTRDGRLVQMDGAGSHVGSLCSGPPQVTLFIGRNKLCPSGLLAAITRIKRISCPLNAKRLGLATPCATIGSCDENRCESSLCRGLLVLEKPFPHQRVTVYLIDEDLGC